MDITDQTLLIGVGERVRKVRECLGWSQENLADLSGCHRNYIGRVERGEFNIGLANAYRLSTVLGVTIDYLIRG